MSFFDTISRIIQQGKEMAVKATPSSTVTYNKVTPVDNSQFQSNPLLRDKPLQYQAPVIQQPTFNVPVKAEVPLANTKVAVTTPEKTNQTMAQTVSEIIQGGKESVKLGGGLAKDVFRGTNRAAVAGGTFVGARVLGADVNQANQAQFKPKTGLEKFLFGDQPASIQSEGITPLESMGVSPEKATKYGAPFVLGSIALDAFTGGSSKAAKKTLEKVAANMTAEDATLLRNLYARPTAKDVLPVARNEQAIINALKLDKLPYAEQKKAVSNILEAYEKRWGGVDEALNPPVKPNRAGAMDVKKPNVLDKTVLAKTDNVSDPKKYKTADEFVAAQGETTYRGASVKEWEDVKNTGSFSDREGTTLIDKSTGKPIKYDDAGKNTTTSKELADGYAKNSSNEGVTIEFKPEAKAKMRFSAKFDSSDLQADEFLGEGLDINDVARVTDKNGKVIYESSDLGKTKSQLTDTWKQANTKQKPNKMADYRAGKPNSEGGYIQNPLAGKGETPKSNNQVVSSGNDSIKVYHGTNDKFDNFDKTKQKSGYYPGAYTTTDIASTKKFGSNLMEANIDAKKFYKIKDGGDGLKAEASKAGFETKMANGNGEVEYLKSKGYEGIQRGNEFIIFDPVNLKRQVQLSPNDSIKPKSAPVSYETKLQQRVDLLRQVPNKNARVQRELAKKSWKLSDLMTKKAARNEKLSEVRDTKIVDRGVKDRIKLASSAGETRSLSKLAEEQGLYETQQRNLTPEMLEKRRFEIQMEQEALDADPVSELSQFVAKRGEFKGTLPEQATTKSGFGLDERVTGAGFDSTEEARQAYDLYKQRKANLLEKKKILADDIRIARNEKNTEQSFARKVSPIESLTKRVATNASKITKRVEQKATKRQVDFEKREAKRQVDTTKKIYGEKIKEEQANTRFTKRVEQKVAARQVQFEKREARRQVIKAKAELIDKMRKSSSEITAVKSDIVEYAKNNLPTSQVGKFISVVKNATNRRQAVQAFNRIDNLVTEIEKKTLIRDIQKSVANLPDSVEIGYATKIKELVSDINLKGYSKATVQKLEETQKYLIEQKKLGKDVELPSRLLEKLKILGRTDAKNLTVSQLQGIQDEIELLKHLGKTKQRIKTNLYEAEKAYIAEDLISTAKPLSYKEIKTTPGVAQTLGIKTANKVKQVLNRLKKARMSIRPIDGLAEATGMEQVKNRIDLSYSNYLDKLDNFAKQREEIVDRLKLKDTNMERIGIYAAKQQDGGYEKLANLGITEEAADAIKLTDAEQEYYEFGRKMFDEDFDEVKAYMQDVYNKDVGKVDNYVSFQTDFNAMSELEIYDRFGTLADDAVTRTKTVKKDFTESRTGSGGQKIKLNFDSILIRHKDNVSYMLNLGKDIKMYSEVLNDPTLRTKLGDLGTFAWKEYMSLMARKGGVDSQKQIATIDMLRRNLGVGVMAYKLSTALVQVSSLADAAATIGSKWVSIGVYDIASNREARKFIIDNFPEIREMIGDDIAFLELGDDWLGKVQQAGFIPLRKLDALMRSTSAIAAYKKLASDAGITVDFAKPNKDLIQKATKLVRQSQGSSSFKDSPLALTTGSFTGNVSVDKAIFQFQSFMLNRWENIERQIWREGFGSGNYVKGFTAVFWMVVAAGIIEESSRRVSRGAISLITGEDKEEDPFIETVIGNTTKNVPIAGNIMNSLAYDSNPVPFINAAETTLGGYKRAFTGVETATKAKGAVDATLGTANLLFGIPGTVQAGQLIKPFIGERDGSGNKELDETIKDSKEKEKNRSKDAEAMLVSLKSLPPDRANAVMKELKVNDEAMFNKVKALKQAEDLNWSKEEKAIANLGVTDGTKARYVYSQVNKLGTAEEKNAYLKELLDRKIISKEVLKQIKDLKEGGKNNDIIE